jgi:steroid delta-isomerase-like uncharacterized protein
MTSENHKAIARRFIKAFETNDQVTIKEVLARDFMLHVPGAPGPVDRETHAQGISVFSEAFSELHVTIEDQIAEGDKVATRLTWRATHTRYFQGLAPTGNKVAVSAISIERIKDGKIVERWFNQDQLGLMRQLGVVPPPQPGS